MLTTCVYLSFTVIVSQKHANKIYCHHPTPHTPKTDVVSSSPPPIPQTDKLSSSPSPYPLNRYIVIIPTPHPKTNIVSSSPPPPQNRYIVIIPTFHTPKPIYCQHPHPHPHPKTDILSSSPPSPHTPKPICIYYCKGKPILVTSYSCAHVSPSMLKYKQPCYIFLS